MHRTVCIQDEYSRRARYGPPIAAFADCPPDRVNQTGAAYPPAFAMITSLVSVKAR